VADVVALGAGRGSVVLGADGKRRFVPPPPLEPGVPDASAAKAALVDDVQALLRQGQLHGGGHGHTADGGARAAPEVAGTTALVLPALHARSAAASTAAAAGRSQFPWRQGRQQTAALAAAAAQAAALARASGPGAHPLVRLGSSSSDPLLPSQLLQPAYAPASLAAPGASAPAAFWARGAAAQWGASQFAPALAHQHAAAESSSNNGSPRLPARAGAPPAAHLSAAPGLSAASSAYSSRPR
jgi:hypothetical protein